MRATILGVVAAVVLATGLAQGTVYDYTTSGFDGASWGIEKYDAGYWDAIYTQYRTANAGTFQHILSYAATGPNSGAFVWSVPAGEIITKVEFSWFHNAIPDDWTQVVYNLSPSDSLSGTSPTVWQETSCTYGGGDATLTFTPAQNIQKIGLGFMTPIISYPDWMCQFSDVVITTVPTPEPATIGLITIGGLLLRRKNFGF